MNPKDSSEALREFERIEGLLRAENCDDDEEVYEEDVDGSGQIDDSIPLDTNDSEDGGEDYIEVEVEG